MYTNAWTAIHSTFVLFCLQFNIKKNSKTLNYELQQKQSHTCSNSILIVFHMILFYPKTIPNFFRIDEGNILVKLNNMRKQFSGALSRL